MHTSRYLCVLTACGAAAAAVALTVAGLLSTLVDGHTARCTVWLITMAAMTAAEALAAAIGHELYDRHKNPARRPLPRR